MVGLHDEGVALKEKSEELEEKSVRNVGSVALPGESVELVGKSVKSVRSVELVGKSVELVGKSVELVGKSVDMGVVKLDPKWFGSVELVEVDELPLGESHDSLGGRDVLEVHAEGVGEVNQGIAFISQN